MNKKSSNFNSFQYQFWSPVYNGPLMDSPLSFYTFMLHHFHVALFPFCNLFVFYFFHDALSSWCTLFMLHFFCVVLSSCCTFFMLHSMLHFFRIALFSWFIFFSLFMFSSFFTFITLFMLHSFFTFFMFHFSYYSCLTLFCVPLFSCEVSSCATRKKRNTEIAKHEKRVTRKKRTMRRTQFLCTWIEICPKKNFLNILQTI